MEFVNPGLLYGLFAISIPVIIHLFNFRRFKKVYFSNVSFIQEIKLQTQKQSKLKHLIILLMRIMAIICLVLAFVRPYFPAADNPVDLNRKNFVSIYIDNSFSMQAISENGNLLEEAKEKAREIVSVYKSTDQFQLLTNEFEGRHQRFVSKEEFTELVNEVRLSPSVKNLKDVFARQAEIFKTITTKGKSSYILSDFQRNFMIDNPGIPDSSVWYYFIPHNSANTDNVYIDSCWFESPVQQKNQNLKLMVRVKNSSASIREKIPVKLHVNGQQKALATLDIEAKGAANVMLSYTSSNAGIQFCEIELTDYPVIFDDRFYLSYSVSDVTEVLCLNGNGENFFLNSLFDNDTTVHLTNVPSGNLDFSSFPAYNLIILNELSQISSGLNQELTRYVENGGNLVVLPSGEMEIEGFGQFTGAMNAGIYQSRDTANTAISYINLEHPVYSDVFDEIPENIDLPKVFDHYVIAVPARARHEKLLETMTGNIFLNLQPFGGGKVYLFAVPMNSSWSSFPRHAIFVPTFYKIAISSFVNDFLYLTPGQNEVFRIRNISLGAENVFKITSFSGEFEIIPEHRRVGSSYDIFIHNQITEAGNYNLSGADSIIRGLAFNYDRSESELVFLNSGELDRYIVDNRLKAIKMSYDRNKSFAREVAEVNIGITLWRWFVLFALFFLMAEILLLRFWK
jgi:hypothetical protein